MALTLVPTILLPQNGGYRGGCQDSLAGQTRFFPFSWESSLARETSAKNGNAKFMYPTLLKQQRVTSCIVVATSSEIRSYNE